MSTSGLTTPKRACCARLLTIAGSDVRLRKLAEGHTLNATTNERLGELERRMTTLDIRVLSLEGRNPSPK